MNSRAIHNSNKLGTTQIPSNKRKATQSWSDVTELLIAIQNEKFMDHHHTWKCSDKIILSKNAGHRTRAVH